MIVGSIILLLVAVLAAVAAVRAIAIWFVRRALAKDFPRAATFTRRQRRNLRSMRADIRPALRRSAS